MDWTTILGIILVIALIALYLYNRNRIEPQGTYDDKDYRSRGSIGGSKERDYDDPDFRSGGSIGGDPTKEKKGTKSYDSPDYKSGGSIGG
jgi:hypothetical protein